MNWDDIKPFLKKVLYKSPHPMFIWNEGTSQQFILTGATLYWSIKEALEKGENGTDSESAHQLSQRGISLLFLKYLKEQGDQLQIPEKGIGEREFENEQVEVNVDLNLEDSMKLIKDITNFEYKEIHIQGSHE